MIDYAKPIGWWCPVCGDISAVWGQRGPFGFCTLCPSHQCVLKFEPLPTPEPSDDLPAHHAVITQTSEPSAFVVLSGVRTWRHAVGDEGGWHLFRESRGVVTEVRVVPTIAEAVLWVAEG